MKKVACVLMILGMAGVTNAGTSWTGAAGDNLWSHDGSGGNWDNDPKPGPADNWDVNKPGMPLGNWAIQADVTTTAGNGRLYYAAGKAYSLTVLNGVTLTTGTMTIDNNAGVTLTVQSGGQWNIAPSSGQMLNGSGTNIDIYGGLNTYDLRLLDGNVVMDVYGLGECYKIGKFSDDGGHAINVYNGGRFAIGAGGINWDGNTTRRIGMYVSGTVQRSGNWTSNYLTFVTNKEPGTWEVDYGVTRAGWTTIHLTPEPATAALVLLGLPLLARRRR